MRTSEEMLKIVDKIDGWLMISEAIELFNRAAEARKPIVEIGSWKGKSAICLAMGTQAGSKQKVYSVDHHTGSEEHHKMYGEVWTLPYFLENIVAAKVSDTVVPLVMTSSQAAEIMEEKISLLFIDGAHDYENVTRDFNLWAPKLEKGGLLVLHDIAMEGPKCLKDKIEGYEDIDTINLTYFARKMYEEKKRSINGLP